MAFEVLIMNGWIRWATTRRLAAKWAITALNCSSSPSSFASTQEKEWNPEEVELKSEKDQIKFEDFDKVEIRVAEVKEVEKVEGSDKLLRFRLDAGDGEDRQILSGIAKFYPNEQELVGKKLQVVANLKPRKMMKKYVSQGMILSAEHDGKLTVLTVDPSVPNGSVIG